MSSHIQFFKDQLKQFDRNVEQWRQEIDERYAWIAKEQEARLRVQAMMEQIFGAPDTTIVMQDMRMAPGMLSGGRQPVAALAAPPQTTSTAIERKKERQRLREHTPERRNYKREYERRRAAERKAILAKYGQHGQDDEPELNGHSIDHRLDAARKVRSDKGIKKPRAADRIGTHVEMAEKVKRIFIDRPSTPLMSREVIDLVYPSRVPSKRDKQDVYLALYALKKDGFLAHTQMGEPYTLAHP